MGSHHFGCHDVAALAGTAADSRSAATRATPSHRLDIGQSFNAPAHAAGDGTAVPASPGCALYRNYFYGANFPA
ncbi:MAG TPA: hypothetical protein VH478_02050 [Trebonia sp.]|jgi:hypothetical protein|nr:hypothetical protein [Trebonia sp.]